MNFFKQKHDKKQEAILQLVERKKEQEVVEASEKKEWMMIYEEFLKTSHEDVQTIWDKSFHFLGQEMTIFLFKGSHSLYSWCTWHHRHAWYVERRRFIKI